MKNDLHLTNNYWLIRFC